MKIMDDLKAHIEAVEKWLEDMKAHVHAAPKPPVPAAPVAPAAPNQMQATIALQTVAPPAA